MRGKKHIYTLIFVLKLKEESGKKLKTSSDELDDEENDGQVWGRKSNISLLDQHTELKKLAEGKVTINHSLFYG